MRRLTHLIVGTMVVACVGCESPPPRQLTERSESAPRPPEPEAPPPEKTAEEKAAAAPGGRALAEGKKAVTEGAAAAAALRAARKAEAAKGAPAEGEDLKKAEAGVGVKGKDYGGPGFVTTPIQQYFRVQERIAFEAQIPNSMKIYKAQHDNKGPATHEEFMEVIIRENAVPLPELKPGEEYWYDAETEQLMVRMPKTDS